MNQNPYAPPSHDDGPVPVPQQQHGYRESSILVLATMVCLAASVLIVLIRIWSTSDLNDQIVADAAGHPDVAGAIESYVRERILVSIDLALRGLTGVVFCVFVHRMSLNALALGARGLSFTPGRAVWTFFVPILNLWKPLQAVREIWLASGPGHDGLSWRRDERPGLLTAWWTAWIMTTVLGGLAGMNAEVGELAEARLKYNRMLMTVLVVEAAAGVLCFLVVRGIVARQKARALELSSPRAWQPAEPDMEDDELPPEPVAPRPRRRPRRRPPG